MTRPPWWKNKRRGASDLLHRVMEMFAKEGMLATGVAIALAVGAVGYAYSANVQMNLEIARLRQENAQAARESAQRDEHMGELLNIMRQRQELTADGAGSRYTWNDASRTLVALAGLNSLQLPDDFNLRPDSLARETLLRQSKALDRLWDEQWGKWRAAIESARYRSP